MRCSQSTWTRGASTGFTTLTSTTPGITRVARRTYMAGRLWFRRSFPCRSRTEHTIAARLPSGRTWDSASNPSSSGTSSSPEANGEHGGVYGGFQFGLAADEGKEFFGTTNSRNMGRDIKTPYVPVTTFLGINGFTALGLLTGPFVKRDAAMPVEYPAPANQDLPFPGPNLVYGINA